MSGGGVKVVAILDADVPPSPPRPLAVFSLSGAEFLVASYICDSFILFFISAHLFFFGFVFLETQSAILNVTNKVPINSKVK